MERRGFPAKAGTQSFRGCRWAPAFALVQGGR
jgi:hypothetical protein